MHFIHILNILCKSDKYVDENLCFCKNYILFFYSEIIIISLSIINSFNLVHIFNIFSYKIGVMLVSFL